jgi:hypothetical protein
MILEETALTIIPALLPILPDSRHEVEELLCQSASYSRPREVVLALNEALQHIEERAERVELSDVDGNEEDEVNYKVLAKEFETVLRCYGIGQSIIVLVLASWSSVTLLINSYCKTSKQEIHLHHPRSI